MRVCILVGKWHMHPCCLNALESFELKLIGRIYIYIYIYMLKCKLHSLCVGSILILVLEAIALKREYKE